MFSVLSGQRLPRPSSRPPETNCGARRGTGYPGTSKRESYLWFRNMASTDPPSGKVHHPLRLRLPFGPEEDPHVALVQNGWAKAVGGNVRQQVLQHFLSVALLVQGPTIFIAHCCHFLVGRHPRPGSPYRDDGDLIQGDGRGSRTGPVRVNGALQAFPVLKLVPQRPPIVPGLHVQHRPPGRPPSGAFANEQRERCRRHRGSPGRSLGGRGSLVGHVPLFVEPGDRRVGVFRLTTIVRERTHEDVL